MVYATERDFRIGRKFCAFYVKINAENLIVEERGDSVITEEGRNGNRSILYLGTVNNPLNCLRLQSASANSFSGYYVGYADERKEAKKGAIEAAKKLHREMMNDLDAQLAKMQATELTFVPKCQCVCNCKC